MGKKGMQWNKWANIWWAVVMLNQLLLNGWMLRGQ